MSKADWQPVYRNWKETLQRIFRRSSNTTSLGSNLCPTTANTYLAESRDFCESLTVRVASPRDDILQVNSEDATSRMTPLTPSSPRLVPLELAAMILQLCAFSNRAVSRPIAPYPCSLYEHKTPVVSAMPSRPEPLTSIPAVLPYIEI